MEYLAKHNRVWQNVATGKILGEKLKLKDGEKLTNYQQVLKPKEELKKSPRETRDKKSNYFKADKNNNEKGEF